jgi:hypothetical protein
VLGLNVGNGNLVIDSAGNISMRGNITMTNGSISWDNVNTDPVASGAAQTAAGAVQGAAAAYSMAGAANTAAVNAETIARQIAAGTFSGGTFIDGMKIYSPEIYANEFKIIPRTSGTDMSSFSIWGFIDNKLWEMFKLYHYGLSYVNFESPAGSYARWNFPQTEFLGKIDFSNATVTGLSSTAVFA